MNAVKKQIDAGEITTKKAAKAWVQKAKAGK